MNKHLIFSLILLMQGTITEVTDDTEATLSKAAILLPNYFGGSVVGAIGAGAAVQQSSYWDINHKFNYRISPYTDFSSAGS